MGGAVFVVLALWYSGIGEPWHLRENLTYTPNDGPEEQVSGYVLRDTGGWITVMTHGERDIVIFSGDDLQSRSEWEDPDDT